MLSIGKCVSIILRIFILIKTNKCDNPIVIPFSLVKKNKRIDSLFSKENQISIDSIERNTNKLDFTNQKVEYAKVSTQTHINSK